MPELLLNEKQRLALHHGKGPAVVFAGPGSGKTTVLTGRVSNLIREQGVSPASILVITYTKAAALSMQQRFLSGWQNMTPPVTFGTFHAVFFQILRSHYPLRADCLLSDSGRRILLFRVMKKLNMEWEEGEQLLTCISLQKNGKEKLPLPEWISEEQFQILSRTYAAQTAAMGKLDFDDMLVKCKLLFEKHADVRREWQARFSYLLADEFQDCNQIQYTLLKMLAAPENNLFVVGDDDQAIYGFRGASPGIMQQFQRDYPEAALFFLTENYRSTDTLVDVAGRVISKNRYRIEKHCTACRQNAGKATVLRVRAFSDRQQQYRYLAEQLKENKGSETAVLCRTNAELAKIRAVLEREQIPCICRNNEESLYERFYVLDLCSYLELAAGHCGRDKFLRILNRPARGLVREGIPEGEVSLKELAACYECCGQRSQARKLTQLAEQIKRMENMSPYLAIRMVRSAIGYDVYLKQKAGEDAAQYLQWEADLDRIQNEAKTFSKLRDWLVFAEGQRNTSGKSSKKPTTCGKGVRLMTLHESKGLEFHTVMIPSLNEGNIPYGKMLSGEKEEEERRLFYVGITRAKTALQLLYVKNTNASGQPSRFLSVFGQYEDSFSESSISSSNS